MSLWTPAKAMWRKVSSKTNRLLSWYDYETRTFHDPATGAAIPEPGELGLLGPRLPFIDPTAAVDAEARHPAELWRAPAHMVRVEDKAGRLVAWKDPNTNRYFDPYGGEPLPGRPANAHPAAAPAATAPTLETPTVSATNAHPAASAPLDVRLAAAELRLQVAKAGIPPAAATDLMRRIDAIDSPDRPALATPGFLAAQEEEAYDEARAVAWARDFNGPTEIDSGARSYGSSLPRHTTVLASDGNGSGPAPAPVATGEPDDDGAEFARMMNSAGSTAPAAAPATVWSVAFPALSAGSSAPDPIVPAIEQTILESARAAGIDPAAVDRANARAALAPVLARDGLPSVRAWAAARLSAWQQRRREIDEGLAGLDARLRSGESTWPEFRTVARRLRLELAGLLPRIDSLRFALDLLGDAHRAALAEVLADPERVVAGLLECQALAVETGPGHEDADRLRQIDLQLTRLYDVRGRIGQQLQAERLEVMARIDADRSAAHATRLASLRRVVTSAATGDDGALRDLLRQVEARPDAFEPTLLPALRGAALEACEAAGSVALADALN